MPKFRITSTFATISPESAVDGEYEDQGYLDKEGIEFESIREAVDYLKSEGVSEPSSSCPSLGTWYSTEGDIDPYSGNTEIRSFHIKGATPRQEKEIYKRLFPQYQGKCRVELEKKV